MTCGDLLCDCLTQRSRQSQNEIALGRWSNSTKYVISKNINYSNARPLLLTDDDTFWIPMIRPLLPIINISENHQLSFQIFSNKCCHSFIHFIRFLFIGIVKMRRSFKNCSTNTVSKSIQLSAFRSALSELHGKVKHQEAAISTISSTTFPLELPQASRLLGSVVGIEGSKVFPTVFESNEDVTKKWQPSPWVFERIQLILNKKTLSSNHPVEDIIDVIREDSKVGSQGMSKQRNIATSVCIVFFFN
jgi:hypothetical protein